MSENVNRPEIHVNEDEIAHALQTWVWDSSHENRTQAFDFLETLPLAVRIQVLLSLWRSEYKGPVETIELNRLQRGIINYCSLHQSWQFVPVFVETLTVTIGSPHNLRVMLTGLLPQWCRETYSPLTSAQKVIMLADLQRFVFRNVGFLRRTFAPEDRLSDEEADFCLAVLRTLRHEALRDGVLKLDQEMLAVLRRLPYSVTTDDPNRSSVLETAQILLQDSQK